VAANTKVHLGFLKLSQVKILLIGDSIREFFGSTNFDVRLDKNRIKYNGTSINNIAIGVSNKETGRSSSLRVDIFIGLIKYMD
jgi:hypothetical protein